MAAGVVLGYLKYVLGFDSIAFKKGMSDAERELIAKQKSFIKHGEKLQDLGKKMSAFITLPLAGLAAKGIQEARETAEAMAQVNAALTSMGPVAGRSAEQLERAANAFERSSLYEADEILKKVTANLLTFGNVAGTNFDRAQQAAIDLATRMGTDLQSATVLVGKALNDPVKGLSALSRVGIQFTEQQKAQIKAMVEAGNAAGAQAIILKELERQYGGAAAAAQNVDPFNKLNDAFKGMTEAIGTALLPLIPPLTDAITGVLNAFTSLSPETQKWVLIAGGIAAILGPIVLAFGAMVAAIGPLIPLLAALKVGMLALFANPIILGAAVAIAGIYLAWKNWDKIAPIVQHMVNGVTATLKRLTAPFSWVIGKVKLVGDAFGGLYDRVVGHSYIPDLVDGIGAHIARLKDNMEKPIWAAAKSSGDAFKQLQSEVGALLDRLFPDEARSQRFLAELALVENGMKKLGFTAEQTAAAVSRLREEYHQELFGKDEPPDWMNDFEPPEKMPVDYRGMEDAIDKAMGANDNLAKNAKNRTAEVVEAFGAMGVGVIGSLRDMVHQFKHGDILGGIQSILDMVMNVVSILGQVGIIKTGAPVGATPRANGGPVVPGRTYLVGERGPEYLRFGSRGHITPPKGADSGARVIIVPSPYFDAHVQGQAARVAAPMAGQAAVMGASGGVQGVARQRARTLP